MTARQQAEAEFIQLLLLEEGVPSTLRRTAGFDVPDFLAAGPRDVLVPESGLEVAREVLRESDIEPVTPNGSPAGNPSAVGLLIGIGIALLVIAGLILLVVTATS